MNSPRCNAAQNTCTFSLIMCLKNLATNTLIPTVLQPLQEPALADMAHDVAAPVRFIKTIGDAVMFVCTDPPPLLTAVLDLVALAAKEGLPGEGAL